jgi:murein DD-endopeptidase MepM/ murein hydrolase activator NlpD
LLQLTSQAREKQLAKQREQAEAETAKYGEAGEIEEAQKIINNPALPANIRAALLKRLQAKQAKKGNKVLTAKGAKPSLKTTPVTAGTAPSLPSGLGDSGRNYAIAPIIPLSQAQMQLRLGQLIGRNLNFAFPLSIPAPVTSLFGWRIHPISGSPRFHRGIDFGAPLGTPIVAAKAGQVQTAESLDGYGLTVIVQHGKAQQTLYGHMSQIFVKPGDVVKKGQLLGLVGSTGNSTGPHLHFEVHEMTAEGWVALDPAIALNGAIALAQNPQALQAASRQPQSFNLAMSGLLDINLPTQTLPGFRLGNSFLSGMLPPSGIPQDEIATEGLQLSLALLPPALPELGILLSPFVDDLAAELAIPLPGLFNLAQTFSFQPLPALSQLPESVAFDPTVKFSEATQVQLSAAKPLAGLTIAEQQPDAVRGLALPAPSQSPSRDQREVSYRDTQRLQLSNRRIKSLQGG